MDSRQTRAVRRLSEHSQHRVFLSATPHNGYSESWQALLELVDPQRFHRGVEPDAEVLDEVLVRRLKDEIVDASGAPEFTARLPAEAITVHYTDAERAGHGLLARYVVLRTGSVSRHDLVTLLLKKRLFSSPAAFAKTLEWVAVTGFGSAALACAAREGFLGWDRELRLRRLELITGNQRLCVLPAGRRPNLASAVLGGCLRRLPADHLAVWGRPVLAVETFTDPSRHAGSCYAAAGFTSVGLSGGYARNRGTKIRHGQPKVYWLRPLHRHGLTTLCAAFDSPLITDRQGRAAVDINTLDIDGPGGLLAALGQVPEHRKARGIRHELAAVLAVATAAVLSGADSTTAIAQHARTLTQPALATLGIRRNKRTHTYVAPSYQTLRRAIRSVDAHALDTAVSGWLHTQVSAGRLSTGQLTALDELFQGVEVRRVVIG